MEHLLVKLIHFLINPSTSTCFHTQHNYLQFCSLRRGTENIELATSIEGSVAEIGGRGQLISDITVDQLNGIPRGENTTVKFGDHATQGLFEAEHGQPDATMVAYISAAGNLEIEIVGISLSEMLGIKTGEKISVHW